MNKRLKKCVAQKKTYRELYKHYKELLEAGIEELRFANMQNQHLLSIIEEIESLVDDKLILSAIKNGKERWQIDRLIHVRRLFGKNMSKNNLNGLERKNKGRKNNNNK